MIDEILRQLKEAIKDNNKKDIKRLYKILNNNGMDTLTINYLLKRL